MEWIDHGVLVAEGEDIEGDDFPPGDLVGMSRRETRKTRRCTKRHDEEGGGEEHASVAVHGGPPEGLLCASCVCQLSPRLPSRGCFDPGESGRSLRRMNGRLWRSRKTSQGLTCAYCEESRSEALRDSGIFAPRTLGPTLPPRLLRGSIRRPAARTDRGSGLTCPTRSGRIGARRSGHGTAVRRRQERLRLGRL